jgi:hypothetical protein
VIDLEGFPGLEMEKPIGISLALVGHLLVNLAHVLNLHIHGILDFFFLIKEYMLRSDGLVSHLVYLDHTTKLSNLVYRIQIGYLMF